MGRIRYKPLIEAHYHMKEPGSKSTKDCRLSQFREKLQVGQTKLLCPVMLRFVYKL